MVAKQQAHMADLDCFVDPIKRVVSKRVVLADHPGVGKPGREHENLE